MSSRCFLFKSFVKSTFQMYKFPLEWAPSFPQYNKINKIRLIRVHSNPEILVEIKQEGPELNFELT
jgi:hypothetical protein